MNVMTTTKECRVRCVYVDGVPIPNVKILLLNESIARVVVIVDCCDFHVFAFKEEAIEFLKQRFNIENFEVKRCPRGE
jgi:hypothetical protein